MFYNIDSSRRAPTPALHWTQYIVDSIRVIDVAQSTFDYNLDLKCKRKLTCLLWTLISPKYYLINEEG